MTGFARSKVSVNTNKHQIATANKVSTSQKVGSDSESLWERLQPNRQAERDFLRYPYLFWEEIHKGKRNCGVPYEVVARLQIKICRLHTLSKSEAKDL